MSVSQTDNRPSPNIHPHNTDVIKYFGCELGAQTKFDKKAGTSIVNGAHDPKKLAELLEAFIKKYVQCYSCGNPETVVKIKKENIFLKCKACGFISEVDPRLRLNSFIIKNPPENKLSKAEKKVKKAEKERFKGLEEEENGDGGDADDKKKKKKKSSSSKKLKDGEEDDSTKVNDDDEDDEDDDDENEEDDDDGVVWMTDTSEDAMKRRAEEQLSSATAAMVTQGNIEAEREAARKREEKRLAEEEEARKKAVEEAEARRKKEQEEEEAARLAAEADALKLSSDPAVAVKRAVSAGTDAEQLSKAVDSVPGGPAQRMKALYEALFADLKEGERTSKVIVSRAALLKPFVADAAGQLAQLVAAEHILGMYLSGRARETPLVLKAMYDEDLVEEDLIVAWYNKKDAGAVLGVSSEAGAAVRSAAKPFVEWLEEEEDGSSEEE